MTLRSEEALCRLRMEEGLFVVMADDDGPRHSVRNRPLAVDRSVAQCSRKQPFGSNAAYFCVLHCRRETTLSSALGREAT